MLRRTNHRMLGVIPKTDVKFLKSVCARLDKEKLTFYRPHKNRNAFALILRFRGADGVRCARMFSPHDIHTLNTKDILKKLESEADEEAPSSLSLFFMRQKDTDEHRWSSAVTFPGGARDRDDDRDDLDCVRRHAYDQLGIPLKGHFVCLGRLRDFWSWSRDLSRGTMSARFVFLHVGDMTPTLRLATHLVRSTAWVPIALLEPGNVKRDRVKHPFYSYVRGGDNAMHDELRDTFSSAMMYFPSVQLPGELGDHFGDVWGSTLSWASSMLVLDGRPRLDWPIVDVPRSFVLQYMVVYPIHAVLELTRSEAAEGVPIDPLHVACLAFDVGLVVAFFAWWTYVVYTTGYVIMDATFRFGSGYGVESEESQRRDEAVAETHAGAKNWLNIPWLLIRPAVPDSTIGPQTEQEYREELETKQMLHKLTNQVEQSAEKASSNLRLAEGGTLVSWNSKVDESIRPILHEKVDFGGKVSSSSAEDSSDLGYSSEDPTVAATVLAHGGNLAEDFDKEAQKKLEARQKFESQQQQQQQQQEEKDSSSSSSASPSLPRVWYPGSAFSFGSLLASSVSSDTVASEMRARNEQAEKELEEARLLARQRQQQREEEEEDAKKKAQQQEAELQARRKREHEVLMAQERQRVEEKLAEMAAMGEGRHPSSADVAADLAPEAPAFAAEPQFEQEHPPVSADDDAATALAAEAQQSPAAPVEQEEPVLSVEQSPTQTLVTEAAAVIGPEEELPVAVGNDAQHDEEKKS